MAAMAFATVCILIFVPFVSGMYLTLNMGTIVLNKVNFSLLEDNCLSFNNLATFHFVFVGYNISFFPHLLFPSEKETLALYARALGTG